MSEPESSNPLFTQPLCVVGVGATTAIGNNVESTAAAVRAGIDGFEEHPQWIDRQGDPYILAMAPVADTETSGLQRYYALAHPSIEQALQPLLKLKTKIPNLDAIIALPEKRPGAPEQLKKHIEEWMSGLNIQGLQARQVSSALKGHALGLMAFQKARTLISSDDAEFCFLGGIDSYINTDTLTWIEDNEQLHMSSNAWGFIPGEAASFCLVCSPATAKKYKLTVKAQIVSVASAVEKHKIKTETVCIGEGLTQAIGQALSALPEDTKVNYTICDQNGEAYRADEYGFTLCRVAEKFSDPSDFLAPADCWGDVGAASGPLYVCLLVRASEKGYSKGAYSLLWASSECGDRCAAIVRTPV